MLLNYSCGGAQVFYRSSTSWKTQYSRSFLVCIPNNRFRSGALLFIASDAWASVQDEVPVHRNQVSIYENMCSHHKYFAEVVPVAVEEAHLAKPSEERVIQVLRSIMAKADLDNLTCGDVWQWHAGGE